VPKLCVLLYSAVLRGSLFGVCHCNELRGDLISIKAIIIIIIIVIIVITTTTTTTTTTSLRRSY